MKGHQLLKDRKKNIKRRPFQGENGSISPSQGVSNQNNCKGGSSPVKQARQKKRSGDSLLLFRYLFISNDTVTKFCCCYKKVLHPQLLIKNGRRQQ